MTGDRTQTGTIECAEQVEKMEGENRRRNCPKWVMKKKQKKEQRLLILKEIRFEQIKFAFEYDTDDYLEDMMLDNSPVEKAAEHMHDNPIDFSITSETNSDDRGSEVRLQSDVPLATLDSLSQRLLRHCDTKSDKYLAIITAGLLQEETSELFINAEVSTSTIGVVALTKYSHQPGDLHAAISAIVAWIKDERQQQKANMNTWCHERGIRIGSLKTIMKYIKQFAYLWNEKGDCKGDDYNSVPCLLEDNFTRFLTSAFSDNLCYYLGHPDLGYKHLKSGEIISCCPASSLHLLEQMPEFVIACKHRHVHVGRGHQICHYMVKVDEVTGTRLAVDLDPSLFNEIIDVDRVSEVSGISYCGNSTRQILQKKWADKDSERSLKRELGALCSSSPVLTDIDLNGQLVFYAVKQYHAAVRDFINAQIEYIRVSLSNVRRVIRLPKTRSNVQLLLTAGVKCEEIYMPREFTNNRNDGIGSHEFMYKIAKGVAVNIEIILSRPNLVLQERNWTNVLLNNILSDIDDRQWYINSIETHDNLMKVQLVFSKPGAAHGAIYLFSTNKSIRIPDRSAIESQCHKMKLYLDGRVFSVVGDLLLKKLKLFSKSTKYHISYKIEKYLLNDILIEITATSEILCDEIGEKIKNIVESSKYNSAIGRDRHGFVFAAVVIGRHTGTWLRLANQDVVEIYGEPARKKKALQLIRKYRAGKSRIMWRVLEEPSCNEVTLAEEDVFHFHSDNNIYVDLNTKTIQLRSGAEKNILQLYFRLLIRGEHSQMLCDGTLGFLPSKSKPLSTCVVCWTETTTFYTLEQCTHQYCYDCMNIQMKVALNESMLPLSCASCNVLFTLSDVFNLAKSVLVPDCKLEKLYLITLKQHIIEQSAKYGICPHPDCSGIFTKAINSADALKCNTCHRRICGKCLDQFHNGMDCKEYNEVLSWMANEPNLRKRCPKCLICIEKIGGCPNVQCNNCLTYMCWECLIYKKDSAQITKHIHHNHL